MIARIESIVNFLLQLESVYKWYVLGAFLLIVTAVVTRFVFKTIKWFFLLAATAVILVAILHYFFNFDFLPVIKGMGE